MATIKVFEIQIDGVTKAIKNQEELTKALKDTRDAIGKKDFGSDGFERLIKTQAELKNQQKGIRTEVAKTQRQLELDDAAEGSYRKLNAQLVLARQRFKELSETERQSSFGKALVKDIQRLDGQLKGLDASIGQYQRSVGNYATAFNAIGGIIRGGLLFAGVSSITDTLQTSTSAVIEQVSAINSLRLSVSQLTDATGNDLDEYTSKIAAISTAFGVAQDGVLRGANSLTDQLTGDFNESLSLIENGFLVGANSSGEFLDILGEYSQQFNAAGLSGSQFISIISQGVSQGIFSDKQADLIKEFGLRIRELPTATKTALEQINISSEQIGQAITNGGIGEAFGLVQSKLRELPVDSQKVGQVLADVFGSAGEDVGVSFINSLDLSNESLGKLVQNFNEAQKAQERQLEANRELSDAQTELANSSKGLTDRFLLLRTQGLTLLTQGLTVISNSFSKFTLLIQPAVQEANNLAGSILNLFRAIFGTKEETEDFAGNALTLLVSVLSVVLNQITATVNVLVSFIEILKATPKFINDNKEALGLLVLGLITFNAQLIATQAATLAVSASIAIATATQNAAAISTGLLRGAWAALNIVMRANPVGLIITAIGLLATGLSIAYNESETFRNVLAGLSNTAKELFAIVKEIFGSFIDGVRDISNGDIGSGLKKIGLAIVKSNPINLAISQGKRLGESFTKGYEQNKTEESIKRNTVKNQAALEESGNILEAQGIEIGKRVGDAVSQGVADSLDPKRVLLDSASELSSEADRFIADLERRKSQKSATSTEKTDSAKKEEAKKAQTELEKLAEQQKKLKEEILSLNEANKPYIEQLRELTKVTGQIENLNKFGESINRQAAIANIAEGQIERLKLEIEDYKNALSDAPDAEIEGLLTQIKSAEDLISVQEDKVKRIQLALSNPASTGVLESDIEEELRQIEAKKLAEISALQELELFEEARAARVNAINQQAEIAALQTRLQLFRVGSNERLSIEIEIANKTKALNEGIDTANLQSRIRTIELSGIEQIEALRKRGLSEKEFAEQRKLIEQQAQLDILNANLSAAEDGSAEKLALAQKVADGEVAINAEKNKLIRDDDNARLAILNEALTGINNVTQGFATASREKTQREIVDIEERYGREIELAEGNTERQEELQQQLEEERRRIAKEDFERQKKYQLASASISFAQGLINILTAPSTIPDPFGAIFKAAQVGFLGIAYAQNVARISATQFVAEKGIDLGKNVEQIRKFGKGGDLNFLPLRIGQVQKGRSHSDGGNHIMTREGLVEYEKGEFADVDEMGNILILNKKSTAKFGTQLKSDAGMQYAGKRAKLSAINSYAGNGVRFAADGISLGDTRPNLAGAAGSIASISTVQSVTVQLSDTQVSNIANAVRQGAADGSKTGVLVGAKEGLRESERQNTLNNNLEI